ncbi:hypothetical protein Lepto7375DRAFT_5405 [Leptolyngbya sp. PCC 7375]|nr:hypothetical protein Lepto7375DRAFT_5405 [Leptolyngbya sp. PCC 7375]
MSNSLKRRLSLLLVDQGAVPVGINFIANGLISWLLNRSATEIPLWGGSSVGVDLLATSLLLPFLICTLVSPQIIKQMKTGKIQPLPRGQLPIFSWYRRPVWQRGLVLSILGLIFAALPVLWVLTIGQVGAIPAMSFVAFKAVWAMLLAAFVSPVVGWWGLANASEKMYQREEATQQKQKLRV